MSIAVHIASPFFTPYMLLSPNEGGLGFSYFQFTLIHALAAIAGFSVLQHWGKITDRFGNKRALVFAGFLIPFIPLFWLFSHNFYYLLMIELFSGLIWAGFNLASANYVFDLVGQKMRMIYSAYYNGLTMLAVFTGALLGSGLYLLASTMHINEISFLFFISFIMRFFVALLFLTQLRELREVENYAFFYELSIRPIQGFIHGAVQSVRDSYVHFKQDHVVDILTFQRMIKK